LNYAAVAIELVNNKSGALRMKKLIAAVLLAFVSIFAAQVAHAALVDRGEGFIYDDVLDITWTQDANINGADTWDNQVAWVDGYSQTHSVYGTFDDWRLASMDVNGDGTLVNCEDVGEAACQDNEYGYLFYQNGISASSSGGLFTNIQASFYWSSTEMVHPAFGPTVRIFHFHSNAGVMEYGDKSVSLYAWAVRSGDVAAVPLPAAVWLFGSALASLGWVRRRQIQE
jgi:hypothetical protein